MDRPSSRHLITVAMFTAALLLGEGAALAQGFIIPELGARKNGTGAAIANPDDLSAIYHNPAALTRMPGTRVGLSLGMAFLQTRVRMAPFEGSDRYITDPVDSEGYYPLQDPAVFAPIPFLGASTNLFTEDLVIAFGVYVPNAAGASFGDDKPSRYHITDAALFSSFFTLAVAYEPFDWLSVGVGASVVYVYVNRNSFLFPIIEGSDQSDLLGGKTKMELTGDDIVPAFNLGIQLRPHKSVDIGFMFLSRYDVKLEGDLILTPGDDAGNLLKTNEAFRKSLSDNKHETEIAAPWIIGFGAAWDVAPFLELSFEFRYYINKHITQQKTTIVEGEVLKTMLPDGLITKKDLRNNYHTGAGFVANPLIGFPLDLMMGFHYESTNTPDHTVEVSAPTFNLAAIHAGLRYTHDKRYAVSAIYSHYWYLERTTDNSVTFPPTNFQGSGYTNQLTIVFEGRFADGIGVSN